MLVAPGNPLSFRLDTTGAGKPGFAELRDLGRRAVEAGRLSEALAHFEKALDIAREKQDPELLDLAISNRAAVLITLGRHAEVMPPLRQILMANRDDSSCFLAAYNLSRAHVRDKASKKGLFYARIARERAESTERDDWRVWASNQLANCLVDESWFDEAADEYTRAFDLLPDEPSLLRATVAVNRGYCHLVKGELEEGFRLEFQGLRWLRRVGADAHGVWPHLDLCYGYLECDRPERALRHGRKALSLAERLGDPDRVKGALFLVGEAEKAAGRLEEAWETFSRLQNEHYPDYPDVTGLMLAVSMRQVVNLRA